MSQYFEDGVSGVPYEINSAHDLAKKINLVLSDPQLRQKLGENAYKTYCEKYHISKYCDMLADLILK